MTTIKRKKPTRSLSEREKRLIALLIDGLGFAAAMLKAGYSRSTACTQAKRTRSKQEIQHALISARIAKGQYVTDAERELVGKV